MIVLSRTNAWAVAGTRGHFLHWNGTTWSPVQAPKLKDEEIASLAAVSADSIWAVGDFINSQGNDVPLVLHWNGKTWNKSTGVPGLANAYLQAVTVAGNDVWAVGGTKVSRRDGPPFILHLTGGRWYVVPSSLTEPLNGLAMTGPASGWAGGTATLLRWNGSTWKTGAALPSDESIAALAAGRSGQVWAVGMKAANLFSLHWNGKTWIGGPFQLSQQSQFELDGVTVIPGGTAWTYGLLAPGFGPKPLIFHWSGKVWTAAWQLGENGGTGQSGSIYGVGAVSASDAWAVGARCLVLAYRGCAKSADLILHWNGKIWHEAG